MVCTRGKTLAQSQFPDRRRCLPLCYPLSDTKCDIFSTQAPARLACPLLVLLHADTFAFAYLLGHNTRSKWNLRRTAAKDGREIAVNRPEAHGPASLGNLVILYITLFVGLCALSLFETFPIWKVNRLALTVFLGGTFWVLSFSRWENGTDWNAYYSVYESFVNNPSLAIFSVGPWSQDICF